MKRIVDFFLLEWKNEQYNRKPLLLRGARQVGKTHAARNLGKSFKQFVEINLEADENARKIIAQDLDPKRIVFQLSQYLKKILFLEQLYFLLTKFRLFQKQSQSSVIFMK